MLSRRLFGKAAVLMTVPGSGGQQPAPLNAPAGGAVVSGVQPGVTGAVVVANKVIVYGSGGGVFVYSGTPGPGNPPIAWMASGTTDPYGNSLPSTTGVAGAGTFSGGDTVVTDGGMYVYDGTPGAGNLPVLIVANGTSLTDPFGGNYLPADVLVDSVPYMLIRDPSTGSYIQMAPDGPVGAFTAYGTGDASESEPSQLTSVISGSGGARTLDTELISPRFSGLRFAELILASESEDGATQGAYTVIGSSSGNELLLGDTSGGAPLALLNANGTAWHLSRSLADTSVQTVTAASYANLSAAWPIPAGDAQEQTAYRLTVAGSGTWGSTAQALQLQILAFGAGVATLRVGSGQFPASQAFLFKLICEIVFNTVGSAGQFRSSMEGSFSVGPVGTALTASTGANGSVGVASFSGLTTVNTTVAATMALQAEWASTTGAPTVSSGYSLFERLGP